MFKDPTAISDADLLLGSDKKILPRDQGTTKKKFNLFFLFLWLTFKVPWQRQFYVLLHRCFKEQMRKRDIIIIQIVQSVLMAVLIGTVFLRVRFKKE